MNFPGTVLLGITHSHAAAAENDASTSESHSEKNRSVGEKSKEVDMADIPWATLPRHRDEDQVRLDVDRSFIYYPNGMCYSIACVGLSREIATRIARTKVLHFPGITSTR